MAEALAEARTSSMLQHPNIVTMYDFDPVEGYGDLVSDDDGLIPLSDAERILPAGTYELAMYIGGALADSFSFELK